LRTTFEVLARTPNEAAAELLLPALDSSYAAINEGALRAIFDRRNAAGQREVLHRLHQVSEPWKAILDQARGRMSLALRDAIMDHDTQLCTNACQALVAFKEYDLMPALVSVLEDETHPHVKLAAKTLLELAELVYGELAAPRDFRNRRDPQVVRRNLTATLELSVARYAKHQRKEVIEAFLLLAHKDNETLKRLLTDPHHAGYLAIVDVLSHSHRGGILRLLLSYLDNAHAPSVCLHIIAHRTDLKFVQYLLARIGSDPSETVLANLRRIDSITWAKAGRSLDELDGTVQAVAVRTILASNMKRLEAFSAIERLSKQGKDEGRRAAVAALAEFSGAEANAAVLGALDDPDPEVQAAAIRQLRQRGIPGALASLIDKLDSPQAIVRQAARDSLSEFTIQRLIAAYDTLDDDVRHSTGEVVKKVDPNTIPYLADEFASRSRSRKLRALDAAIMLELAPQMEANFINLLRNDRDHVVRIEAVRGLQQCTSAAAIEALRAARYDHSPLVEEAVQQSLAQIGKRGVSGDTTAVHAQGAADA